MIKNDAKRRLPMKQGYRELHNIILKYNYKKKTMHTRLYLTTSIRSCFDLSCRMIPEERDSPRLAQAAIAAYYVATPYGLL
jgi:hypothetical protein